MPYKNTSNIGLVQNDPERGRHSSDIFKINYNQANKNNYMDDNLIKLDTHDAYNYARNI